MASYALRKPVSRRCSMVFQARLASARPNSAVGGARPQLVDILRYPVQHRGEDLGYAILATSAVVSLHERVGWAQRHRQQTVPDGDPERQVPAILMRPRSRVTARVSAGWRVLLLTVSACIAVAGIGVPLGEAQPSPSVSSRDRILESLPNATRRPLTLERRALNAEKHGVRPNDDRADAGPESRDNCRRERAREPREVPAVRRARRLGLLLLARQ